MPRFFRGAILTLILRGYGYPRGYELCRRSPDTTGGNRTRLCKGGSASLAFYGIRAGQDLFNPAPPGGTIAVVGRAGFWWRGLVPCLPLSQYIRYLLPRTGGPHCSALYWSVCGAGMEKDAFLGQGSGNAADFCCPASGYFGFSLFCIRAKERYSRKGGNSIGGRNAI